MFKNQVKLIKNKKIWMKVSIQKSMDIAVFIVIDKI